MSASCRRRVIWLSLLAVACSEDHKVPLGARDSGADAEAEVDASEEPETGLPDGCDDDDSVRVPDTLECTGLFANRGEKTLAKSVVAFTPAFPLWSDGADKLRWIHLPAGTKIDNSDPNGWVFPVGTKLWKEFSVGGKRIETRLLWKTRPDKWERITYAWNAAETQATRTLGGDIQISSGTYHIPIKDECDDCHKGQPDSVLGFSAVNLGLPGASGVTLAKLAREGWLTETPNLTELSIGADETGVDPDGVPLAAKALGILHTNCGQTCHNPTPNRKANLTNQDFRLDSTQLDGRAPDAMFSALATAVGTRAQGVQWDNHPFRIKPGDPDNSLVVQLMGYRDPTGMGRGQMPTIGSRVVDEEGLDIIKRWIRALNAGTPALDAGPAGVDAGPPVLEVDAGMDASIADAGVDAAVQMPDASGAEPDASLGSDASVEMDAGTDAGVDAALDAGVDADVPDAALDADVADSSADDAGADAAEEPDAPDTDDSADDTI